MNLPHTSRSDGRHPGDAADCLQLLHRERPLGVVVGRRLHDRARAGGRVYIRHANGIESSGEVVEVEPPTRIVFTYGFNSGKPMPPGSSRVTISLEPHGPRHAARSAPRVRRGRRRATSTCRAGAISCRSLAMSSRTSSTPARRTPSTPGLPRGRRPTRSARRQTLADDRDIRRQVPRPLQPARRHRRPRAAHRRDTAVHARTCSCDAAAKSRHCQGTLLVDWVADDRRWPGARRAARTSSCSRRMERSSR